MRYNRSVLWFLYVSVCLLSTIVCAVPVAFPGAEGFGAYAVGGRGGDVYYVTNTNDSGSGSLREGIRTASGPRTIVFTVSGIIQLQSSLSVNKDYITIAGQTAPGDGICLRDYPFSISADHVIVRYIRSRLGDNAGQEADAISITSGNNIIMDHCSASWSVDEVFSCSTGDPAAINNVTVQWSIISEGLGDSIHSKGYHSYGALIRGCYGAKYSYHHNLFAHNNGRNPRPGNYDDNPYSSDPEGLLFDCRNNVMYNWGGSHPSYDADTVSVCRMNYVGNYCKAGPSSSYGYLYDTGSPYFKAYFEGNYWNGGIPSDPYSIVYFGSWSSSQINAWKQSARFETGPIVTQTAQDAYASVLEGAGASLARDSIDTRIVNEVLTGTVTYYGSVSGKAGIIDDEADVGGWPVYNSTMAPADTDHDGMPDAWETANSFNPGNAADRNYYTLNVDYTNLEVYLNSLVTGDVEAPSAPTGLSAAAGDGTVDLDWDDNSEIDLAGYYVYRSTTSGSGYVRLNGLVGSSDYTDDTAENGITYFYTVTAVDTSYNESDSSNEEFATPINLAFYRDTNGDHSIDMTDLVAFVQLWLQSDCFITSGWDTNGDCVVNYHEFSMLAGNWTGPDTTPPSIPTGLSATAGDSTVSLDWDDNSENDLNGYNVHRSTTSGSDYTLLNISVLSSSDYIDSDVVNGTTYYYVVSALDMTLNESDTSSEVSAMPDSITPTTIEIVASQGKAIQYKNDSGAWVSEERLKTRMAGVWDDDPELNTLDANKSYLQFDISGVTGTITNATLTIYAITDAKSYYVNGLNDGIDETWSADTIDWFTAPGNIMTSGSALNPSQTAFLYFVNPTVADGAASGDVTAFVLADTDGLVTFILTPGGTTYIYNVIQGDYYNADYVPVLTLEGDFVQ